jgi:peroxiredoxin
VTGAHHLAYLAGAALLIAIAPAAVAADVSAEIPLLERVPANSEAPDFDLPDPDGNRHRLADMRGKPIIVNFWATWCPPCRAEMPSMQRAWVDLADEDILLVAINVGEDAETVRGFRDAIGLNFPLPLDIDSEVAPRWPMRGLPTTFVVDPSGRIVYKAEGEREWDDPALLALIRALRSPADALPAQTRAAVDD